MKPAQDSSGAPAAATAGPAVCPACAGSATHFLFHKNGYDHEGCAGCGLVFVHPMPSAAELSAFYAARDDQPTSALCWESTREHLRRLWDKVLGGMEQAGRGRLLDVGCGAGQFLAQARQRGWSELVGLELSPRAATRAREVSGAEVQERDFLSSEFPAGSFAAITFWDVLEHVPEPRRILAHAYRLLRPGGFLVVSTVSWSGLTLRVLKDRALVVMPPEHLSYYSKSCLRKLLRVERFEVISVRAMDIYIREWSRLLGKNEPGASRPDASYQKCYGRLTGSAVLPAMMATANFFLNAAGLGDELVAVARKPKPDGARSNNE